MNELMGRTGITMDSREIAELTGKHHAHVCRDIGEMLDRLNGLNRSSFGSVYVAGNGEERKCYLLPYRETMILVSGYSIELRSKVIDRWIDLEKKGHLDGVQLPDFTNPVVAARAWADEAEKRQRAEIMLVHAQPAIESHAALMRSDHTMSITDAAKHFGLHPKAEVFPYLRERGYLTERDLPTQAAIEAGYLALKETKCPDGSVRSQSVVETRMLETWRLRVVPQIQRWKKEGAA